MKKNGDGANESGLMIEIVMPDTMPTEPRTVSELKALIRRCVAGYPDEQDMDISIQQRDGTPNWECVIKYRNRDHGWGPTPELIREIEGLKRRFHLKE